MIQVNQLRKSFGSHVVLQDINMHVRRGEIFGIVGHSGAGKSTLLKAVVGLSQRQTGDVSYHNESISGWPPHRRARAGLGYVAEDRRLFGALTVQENLLIAARGDVAANLARALDLFPALGAMLQRRASQMSGGEQQMLAIARTLMTSPKLLLLDEPCEGIAPLLVESIRDALLALRAQGLPMLVAEQNRILADRADRVLTLVSGRLAA